MADWGNDHGGSANGYGDDGHNKYVLTFVEFGGSEHPN